MVGNGECSIGAIQLFPVATPALTIRQFTETKETTTMTMAMAMTKKHYYN